MKVWFDCTAAAHPLVLKPLIDRFRPDLGIAHGSVDLALVSAAFFIPSAQLQDYEFAGLQRQLAFRIAKRVLVPDAIPVDRMAKVGAKGDKLVRYPGLKEDYYLAGFEPDPAVMTELGLDRERVLVVVRPPPETSEYHADNPLYEQVIERLAGASDVTAVVIPRTTAQGDRIRAMGSDNLIVPERAIDAQSLIALSDLVVSAGGTMNREAVALGTPVYTTFAGRMGGVDEALIAEGRLIVLEKADDLELVKRQGPPGAREPQDPALLMTGVLGALA